MLSPKISPSSDRTWEIPFSPLFRIGTPPANFPFNSSQEPVQSSLPRATVNSPIGIVSPGIYTELASNRSPIDSVDLRDARIGELLSP
jgi:hypothetical protein